MALRVHPREHGARAPARDGAAGVRADQHDPGQVHDAGAVRRPALRRGARARDACVVVDSETSAQHVDAKMPTAYLKTIDRLDQLAVPQRQSAGAVHISAPHAADAYVAWQRTL